MIKQLSTESYTPWLTRALAVLIDAIPVIVIAGIAFLVGLFTQDPPKCEQTAVDYGVIETCTQDISGIALIAWGVASLAMFAFWVWNYGIKQGRTGSSLGKAIMKFKVVSEVSGEPLGAGRSLLRQIAHAIDGALCYVGFLFPLWDKKRQTLADKLMTTVCLPV